MSVGSAMSERQFIEDVRSKEHVGFGGGIFFGRDVWCFVRSDVASIPVVGVASKGVCVYRHLRLTNLG